MELKVDKKEIQEQRVRGYFIQATKDMLKGEGLKSLSVRSIAERAGYSYATLYNYFKDVQTLVFECVKDFQDECVDFVLAEIKDDVRGLPAIEQIAKGYIKYFVQYPGIFELFFVERVNQMSNNSNTLEMIYNFLDRLTSSEWEYCKTKKILKKEVAESKRNELRYAVMGLLLFYNNRRQPASYQEFTAMCDAVIRGILRQ